MDRKLSSHGNISQVLRFSSIFINNRLSTIITVSNRLSSMINVDQRLSTIKNDFFQYYELFIGSPVLPDCLGPVLFLLKARRGQARPATPVLME